MKPKGLVFAASNTSLTDIERPFEILANSFTKAILTCRKVFSNNFAASAQQRHQKIANDIRLARADGLSLCADEDWVAQLATFLRTRKRRLAMGHRR